MGGHGQAQYYCLNLSPINFINLTKYTNKFESKNSISIRVRFEVESRDETPISIALCACDCDSLLAYIH